MILQTIAELVPSALRWILLLIILKMYLRAIEWYDEKRPNQHFEYVGKMFRKRGKKIGKLLAYPLVKGLSIWLDTIAVLIINPIISVLSSFLSLIFPGVARELLKDLNLGGAQESATKKIAEIAAKFGNLVDQLFSNAADIEDLFDSINISAQLLKALQTMRKIGQISSKVFGEFKSNISDALEKIIRGELPDVSLDSYVSLVGKINLAHMKLNEPLKKISQIDQAFTAETGKKTLAAIQQIKVDPDVIKRRMEEEYDRIKRDIFPSLRDFFTRRALENLAKDTAKLLTVVGKNTFDFGKNTGKNIGKTLNNWFGGKRRRETFGCSVMCSYMELVKDFRAEKRNWCAVALYNKTEDNARCSFPYDWLIVQTSPERDRGREFWNFEVWFYDRCAADFKVLKPDGTVGWEGDQRDHINLDQYMESNNNNILSKLSTYKFEKIKSLCAWDYHRKPLMSHPTGGGDNRYQNPSYPIQIDNFIQDAFIIQLCINTNFLNTYLNIPDSHADRFVEGFIATVVMLVLRKSHAFPKPNDMTGSKVLLKWPETTHISYYKEVLAYMRQDPWFSSKLEKGQPTLIYILRYSSMVQYW